MLYFPCEELETRIGCQLRLWTTLHSFFLQPNAAWRFYANHLCSIWTRHKVEDNSTRRFAGGNNNFGSCQELRVSLFHQKPQGKKNWCLMVFLGKRIVPQTSRKSFDAFSDSFDFYHLNFITAELYGSSTIGDTCWKESDVKYAKTSNNLSLQRHTKRVTCVVFEVLSGGPRLVDVAFCVWQADWDSRTR